MEWAAVVLFVVTSVIANVYFKKVDRYSETSFYLSAGTFIPMLMTALMATICLAHVMKSVPGRSWRNVVIIAAAVILVASVFNLFGTVAEQAIAGSLGTLQVSFQSRISAVTSLVNQIVGPIVSLLLRTTLGMVLYMAINAIRGPQAE